jgi:hypothetical protein
MIWLALAVALSQEIVDPSFERLHSMIRPAQKEAPWSEIPWMTSLWQARERAATEGKPLLIWAAGGGGHPLGLC